MNVLSISFSHNTNNYCSKFPTINRKIYLSQCQFGEQIMDVINVIYNFCFTCELCHKKNNYKYIKIINMLQYEGINFYFT
jgi:translation initiation factor RLI1